METQKKQKVKDTNTVTIPKDLFNESVCDFEILTLICFVVEKWYWTAFGFIKPFRGIECFDPDQKDLLW